jgi:hypothetical protein
MLRLRLGVLLLGGVCWGFSPAVSWPLLWESDETPEITETDFLTAVNEFLLEEDIQPELIQVEIRPLRDKSEGDTGGHWRALAQVFVDETPAGRYQRKIVFDRDYWLRPGENRLLLKQRWSKLMWHEIHHLKYFPSNLKKSKDLATLFPAKGDLSFARWRQKWIRLQEPLEEWAAEKDSLQRFKKEFGEPSDTIMRDSRKDLLKHAADYKILLADILVNAIDPNPILQIFPVQLAIDSNGNILPD